ncbi:MAG: helix-hairpin-helix domain-containing protein [Cyclobacteriaceae bacterium]
MRTTAIILLVLAIPILACGRQSQVESYFQSLDNSPVEEETDIDTEYTENWVGLKVDINRAGLSDLLSIPGITAPQAEAILNHRAVFGAFISLHELQAVEQIETEALKKLLPYLTVREKHLLYDPRPFAERLRSVEKRLLVRTGWRQERSLGYTEPGGYAGYGPDVYARLLIRQPQDFSIGLAAEQDKGEPYRLSAVGADHLSAHFMIENRGVVKRLVAGDFRFNSGAGLIFGGGFPSGKWPADLGLLRPSSTSLMPHSSGREGQYFRGAGVTLESGRWQLTAIASHRAYDAALQQDSLGQFVTSFSITGLHRTPQEIDKRGNLPVSTGAVALRFAPRNSPVRVGLTLTGTRMATFWRPKAKVYNPAPFTGDRWAHAGIWYTGYVDRLYYFGEAARVFTGGDALMSGGLYSFSKRESMAVIVRHYSQDYHSYYGRGFGENSRLGNETGIYTAFRFSPFRRINILLGADHFVFPGLRYRSYAPSQGREYAINVSRESRTLTYSLSWRDKLKPRNSADDTSVEYLPIDFRKQQLALQLRYKPKNYPLSWQSRVYWNRTLPYNDHGFGIAQDLSATVGKWALSGRIALFDTDTFDNRLYLYEKDVWGTFTIPMYYGQGIRSFWLVRYKASRQLSIWARMGRFRYRDRETTGSGLNEVQGDKTTDFRLQLTYRWW